MTIRTMASLDATLLCGGLLAACALGFLLSNWAPLFEWPRADAVAEVDPISLHIATLPASIDDTFSLAKR